MSTYNRVDLQTLGSQPVIMLNNLPDHWFGLTWRNDKETKARGPGEVPLAKQSSHIEFALYCAI